MNNIRLAITLLNNLRPVGPVSERDHALLTDRLVRELGNDYSSFLAEPIPSGNGAQVDWYVNASTRPRPFEELDPQSKSALLNAAESRKMSILTLADRLEQGARGDKEIAKALRNAMVTPDKGWLYDVDGKPVLVGWGYVSAQNEQRTMGLTGVGGTGVAATQEPHLAVASEPHAQENTEPPLLSDKNLNDAASQKSQSYHDEHIVHTTTYLHNEVVGTPFYWRNWLFWLFWLLVALLALILFWLLLSSSALKHWGTIIKGPKAEISDTNDAYLQKIADLNQEITDLQNQTRLRQQDCLEQRAANRSPLDDQPVPRANNGRNPFNDNQPEQRLGRGNDSERSGQPDMRIVMPQNGADAPQQQVENTPEAHENGVNVPQQQVENTPEAHVEVVPVQVPETPSQSILPEHALEQQPERASEPEVTSEPEVASEPEVVSEPEQLQTDRQREVEDIINRAGVKTGALQITLIWKGKADLDLSIVCPNGTRVYFKRRSSCGAILDRDANQNPNFLSPEPVENIYWSDPSKIPPKVPVYVDYYDNHGDPRPNTPFRLRIRKTIVDPQTGQSKVEDKIIDGVANGERRRNPRQIYVITNP